MNGIFAQTWDTAGPLSTHVGLWAYVVVISPVINVSLKQTYLIGSITLTSVPWPKG